MKYKTINDLEVKGKRILLRIDLNSSFIGNKIQENDRYKAHSETIKLLKKKKAVVIILSHQSNPGKKDFTNLKQHSKLLNKYVKIKFVDDIIGKKAQREIEKLRGGQAILLDNIRFLKDEFKPGKNKLVKVLSGKSDYYVNDAFSVCHRNQTSVVSFPKYLESAIGPNIENELNNLKKLRSKLKDSLFILGGNKTSDIMHLTKHNKILSTGILSLWVLKIKGYKLGKEDKLLKNNASLLKQIRKNSKGIKCPIDLAINSNGKRKEILLDDLPVNKEILDIGGETIKAYIKEINKAKAIFFKGAIGKFEKPGFEVGTKKILQAIAKTNGFKLIAGGSSSSVMKKFRINKKGFSYVSLAGGALVYYLAEKKLPGLEAIKHN